MKERIVEFNKQFGLNTEFIIDSEIEGYSLNNTIYLNENSDDLEKVNKHELLHFFESDETFNEIKEKILKLNEENLDIIRREYYLRYYGLYTEEEIQNGIIDIEIVIDILIGNYIFKFDQGLKIGDYVLKEITKNLEQKRYLNLNLTSQIDNMNMSKWDKLFILNFYDGKEHVLPQKEGRKERINEDIKQELERLYNLHQDEFIIKPESKDVIREYESELKALESRGEDNSHLKKYKKQALEELANQFTKQLYVEYKHIVDLIKEAQYEDSFKVLMLRETLSKTYKLDTKDGKKTIVNKRNMHESIASHMTLNDAVLNLIYNNVNDYNNFANLYFAGLEIFNQTIAQKNNVSIDNVDVYEMGRWIKFDGKTTDSNNYIKNAQELSSLVKDTPWCTKTLASSQLAQGDFYVFVDNDNKPHIAVKMNGNEIDEVRGIMNGNAQELEEDYRKVAISFLENNKEIKNGDKWLKKEEWNKRLLTYIHNIENDTFKEDDVEKLIEDYLGDYEYKAHFSENTNMEKLRNLLPRIKKKMALYYNCREDELLFEDVNFADKEYSNLKVCPYKVVLGNVNFKYSPIESLGDLIIIGGNANFWNSKIQSLGNLTTIGGSAEFGNSQIESLGNLTTIGGNAFFRKSQVQSLGDLITIGGEADFMNFQVQSLGNLTTIGGNAVFVDSQIQSLGNLTTIGGDANFRGFQIQSLGNLTIIGGDACFGNSEIQSLGNLTTIGGNADFENFQIESLGNLTTIGGDADFKNFQIESLGNLTTIGGNADFENSQIQSLGNLTRIDGSAYFTNSKIQSLGVLTTIGGEAVFWYSKIQSLGNLTTIGGDADFENFQIQSLDNLTTIGGDAYFINSQVQSLGNLTTIGRHAEFENINITNFGNIEYIGNFFSDSKLLKELYHQEYDDTGHRIKKRK